MIARVTTALLVALVAPAPAERSIAFWNVSVIDLDAGSALPGMVVEVSNGRIMRVEPAVGARPKNATIVNGTVPANRALQPIVAPNPNRI